MPRSVTSSPQERSSLSLDLTPHQSCDLELVLTDAFAPLKTFQGREDYEATLNDLRTEDGKLWPMPVTLDVPHGLVKEGDDLDLLNPEGAPVARLAVDDVFKVDKKLEAMKVFGTTDVAHPAVQRLLNVTHDTYVSGKLTQSEPIHHFTFGGDRHTPAELKEEFSRRGWDKVIAFQTRNPLHRAHVELTMRAMAEHDANLLLHPVIGQTKPGDVNAYSRVRCYRAVMDEYAPESAMLSLLPLAMRMGGPREALWHALIRKNFGATHFIVGRDHAGPGVDSTGQPFYGPYDAQDLVREHQAEAGIEMVPFRNMVYVEDQAEYMPDNEVPEGARVLNLSGTELRRRLRKGLDIPEWFSYPTVLEELRKEFPERSERGFTVFFTGLSGAGKSTIANALMAKLMEVGTRPVTLLDGDVVRKHLSSELGFSRAHRDLNVERIGFVASEITKNRGVAICAPIAPYDGTRKVVRSMIEGVGGFFLVHVATPLDVCEGRDRKGLYKLAREGKIKEFTGISDPYEIPEDADVVIDTSALSPERAAHEVFRHLESEGFIA